MADAAAQNLPQDVAAAFIRRQNSVTDQEGGGAGVIGNDPKGGWTSFSIALLDSVDCCAGSD